MLNKKNITATIAGLMLLGALSSGVTAALPAAASTAANKTEKALAVKKSKWKTVDEALDWMYKNQKKEGLWALYNPNDGLSFYTGVLELKSYKEFAKKQAEYKGPAIPEPGNLPDGYQFKVGMVYSQEPQRFGKEYKQIQKQLKAEAAKKGEKYYVKKLTWDVSGSSQLIYGKGNGRGNKDITIIAEYKEELPEEEQPEGATLPPEMKVSRELLEIGGTEAVYITHIDKLDNEVLVWNILEWNSADGKIRFRIMSEVGKEELMDIAETIIAKEK
ncbi:hypothetical protein WJ0W_002155 [Paenibacillus melissococcoides]|uniref:DUF4367 domain-containing protein n=1 Tax=Paenibacillus melissococcoides TaxID=2912268 RepID=A0ABM9G032_9BACL|nr:MULTISPECIES: hypothetical protein [Paenibacillus]MEB9894710.1 hypothetical protein [Bacillus cereus]CAH8244924.1 hypothetical protein WJ0W_002155 [Paenibacillus melissococcoides]CAH8709380.1 hypothetical protein WDD9_002236 [Paenibacillus melissococcoides]CAH8710108.1 hypothetical protein HTL2_002524 [Paenibacillus melissococcoides]GIO79854.1 hypothetical protein J6TS7_34640 [Paenibacillus dendritiformis]